MVCRKNFCDNVSSSNVYTENGDVTIKYISNKEYSYSFDSFILVVTQFSISGTCPSWGYLCDNGRCIDANLKCKGYNPCGDNSVCLIQHICSDWDVTTSSDKFGSCESEGNGANVDLFIRAGIGVVVFTIVIVTSVICRLKRAGTPSWQTRTPAQPGSTAPPMQDAIPNIEQFNQGFSHELRGIQVQQTTENVPQSTPVHDQLPPPYDPEWAPKT
ncbi:hypothetical protein DPMN_172533 [Dreissena polymorpha]|uniref:Uncharacterized protein n=1 Tax=Dreissena polymorpha TaxID=45954 RepID=A0A9D4E346_DREPO|nr:hypothetical protein DPMN_172533 [Dreissena polymorpha]